MDYAQIPLINHVNSALYVIDTQKYLNIITNGEADGRQNYDINFTEKRKMIHFMCFKITLI